MLGLLLIYFIGRAFYQLAHEHDKPTWGFAILGVATYYVGTFIAGIFIAIFLEIIGSSIEAYSDIVLSLIALPFGLLACYIVHSLLKKNWERKAQFESDIIDEIGNNEYQDI